MRDVTNEMANAHVAYFISGGSSGSKRPKSLFLMLSRFFPASQVARAQSETLQKNTARLTVELHFSTVKHTRLLYILRKRDKNIYICIEF